MLRRFRKRRDGGTGGEPLFQVQGHADKEEEDVGGGPDSLDRRSASGPLSASLDNEDEADHTMRFDHTNNDQHIHMSGRGGGGAGHQHHWQQSAQQRGHVLNYEYEYEGNNNNNPDSNINIRVISPENNTNTTPNTKPAVTTTPSSIAARQRQRQRQESARQKLDSLSRQHRRHQHQHQHHASISDNTPNVSTNVNTLLRGDASSNATTADTSDTYLSAAHHHYSPQQHQHQHQHQYHCARNSNSNSMVPPSSLTRHLAAACGVMDEHHDLGETICNLGMGMGNDNNDVITTNSLESSSYYSKHDFYNLSRQHSISNANNDDGCSTSLESTSFLLEEDHDGKRNHENNNTTTANNQQQQQSNGKKNKKMTYHAHIHDYQPAPPLKRSGTFTSNIGRRGEGGKGAGGTSSHALERRKVSQQLHNQQQQQEQLAKQQAATRIASSPIVSPPPLKRTQVVQVTPYNNNNTTKKANEKEKVVESTQVAFQVTSNLSPGEVQSSQEWMVKPNSTSNSAAIAVVTPSPTAKISMHQEQKKSTPQNNISAAVVVVDSTTPNSSINTVAPKKDANLTTASTASASSTKIVSSSTLIGKLLKRHQSRKMKTIQEQQQLQQQQQQQKGIAANQYQQEQVKQHDPAEEGMPDDERQSDDAQVKMIHSTKGLSVNNEPAAAAAAELHQSTKKVKIKEAENEEARGADAIKGKGKEPPADYRHMQSMVADEKRRPDPPPDPPAEYHHLSSRVFALADDTNKAKQKKGGKSNIIKATRQQRSSKMMLKPQQKEEQEPMPQSHFQSKEVLSSGQEANPGKKLDPSSAAEQTGQTSNEPVESKELLVPKGQKLLQRPSQESRYDKKQTAQKTTDGNNITEEWSTPLPFKKVDSTPSNFSSFFTFQTANTTSTSKFWDDVSQFSDDPNYPKKQLFTERNNGGDRQHDEYFKSHLVTVEKEKIEKFRHANVKYRQEQDLRQTMAKNKPNTATTTQQQQQRKSTTMNSIGEDTDAISNAFSLKLPMNQRGQFDDTDISGLQMNDSATVYFLRQLNGNVETSTAAAAATEYWKKKYDQLKEETDVVLLEMNRSRDEEEREQEQQTKHEGGNQKQQVQKGQSSSKRKDEKQTESKQVELKEIFDNHQHADTPAEAEVGDVTYGSLEETFDTNNDTVLQSNSAQEDDDRHRRCAAYPLAGMQELLEGIIDLDNCEIDPSQTCGDYGGGKKARHQRQHQQGRSQHSANNCSPGISREELNNVLDQAQKARDMSVTTMKKTAEDMLTFVAELEGACEEKTIPRGGKGCTDGDENEVLNVANISPLGEDGTAEEVTIRGPTIGTAEEITIGTDDSNDYDLKPIGFIPCEYSPTCDPQALLLDAGPGYTMEDYQNKEGGGCDIELLKQWNEDRIKSPKSLADDLTRLSRGTASRLSSAVSGDEQSELSANAKAIFDAALKYDMKTLKRAALRSPHRSTVSSANGIEAKQNQSVVSSMADGQSNFGSNVPTDFTNWFELPSPGGYCIPLLPLLDGSLRNSVDVLDSLDITPKYRADDTVDLAFSDFARSSEAVMDSNKLDVGPIIADGDNGSVRFANAATHLRGISDAAVSAIAKREFQDAMDIYNTLLRSCQTCKESELRLVGQLIASTLYNLSVLHLWQGEYDQALPYCRESLRIKTDEGDEASVNIWANLGLINYAMGSLTSSLAAFRKAIQMSTKFFPPNGQLTGQLVNNMAVVNFDIGKLPLVQSQFKQSLQIQKGNGSFDDINAFSVEDLFSISISIFNVGVVSARQHDVAAAISHLQTCLSIQEALLEGTDEVVQSTSHYLASLKKKLPSSSPPANATSKQAITNQTILPKQQVKTEHQPKATHTQVIGDTQLNRPMPVKSDTPKGILKASTKGGVQTEKGNGEVSHPMLRLGSLRAESSVSQRVKKSLEGCASDSLALGSMSRANNYLTTVLMCKKPPPKTSRNRTMSHNLINYGLQTMKKREAQTELQQNLQRYGKHHPLVGESHFKLGLFYLYTDSFDEAVLQLEHSSRIATNTFGTNHPEVASTLMFKGLAQLADGRLDDSLATMVRLRQTREAILGKNHPEIGQIINNIACVQYELGNCSKAESFFQEALDLLREVFSTAPPLLRCVSTVLENIAFLHAKAGSFPKALIELEGALQIKQDILLEDISRSDITENMAHILAIQQLSHGAGNLNEMTDEYLTMLMSSK